MHQVQIDVEEVGFAAARWTTWRSQIFSESVCPMY